MRARLRRHRAGIAALALAVVALLLVLFALDVRTWQRTVTRDDMRFQALPDHAALWRPSTILPGDPAGAALGTHDVVAWRHALQYFWFTRAGAAPDVRLDLPTLRAIDQSRLLSIALSAAPARERSAAANLLGVLVITGPVVGNDQDVIAKVLRQGASYFQSAIAIDPSDTDAKQNLELVLRITRPGKGRLGRDARAGFGFGRGRGAGKQGAGY